MITTIETNIESLRDPFVLVENEVYYAYLYSAECVFHKGKGQKRIKEKRDYKYNGE